MTKAYRRPTESTLGVVREPREGHCPRCGSAALAAYPVLSEGGWFDVVRCQDCLHSVSRTPGPRHGAVQFLSDHL